MKVKTPLIAQPKLIIIVQLKLQKSLFGQSAANLTLKR